VPLTEQQSQAKEDTRRYLSGEVRMVQTLCLRCKRPSVQPLPVEYVESAEAWRVDGRLVVYCNSCQ
jgi:hypothetical protein